ncbi:hypothetical protein [Carboxylicivirga linearis]|uniref:Sugar transporter n=1 Tax=Carboxylicivirga linearis TaxID=1628157 RepID=A0ABS5JXN4_9BACT|nr:hypothetical protein [Carboxylicivirga linearis]MBS2099219.1 hypothetical protein [Carboxylicivirga linearis]
MESAITQKKAPVWFWILAVLLLLWNIMGVVSFFMHAFISDEALAKLPENERALYAEYPFWSTILFAIAVLGGLLGSIAMVARKKAAVFLFIISFLVVVPQMIHNVFFTQSIAVYGLLQATLMPILVVLIGAFLIWFSIFSKNKNWLK